MSLINVELLICAFIFWRTFNISCFFGKEYLMCCLLFLQICNSFLANTWLMFAVMTLDYVPSLGHCSFVFVLNYEQVLSFDYYSYFPRFYYHHYFHYLPFYFLLLMLWLLVLKLLSVFFFCLFFIFCVSLAYFVCSFHMVVDLFHVSDKRHFIVYFSCFVTDFGQIYSALLQV